jgi:catechol 2,3-dioxygenase-like lactoylglutathione lyase family enzyme
MLPQIFETVLYGGDLPAMERFYCGVLGLEVITRSELVISFRCDRSVLLIFNPALSSPAGRDVPSHGNAGPGHLAFRASAEELEHWRERLTAAGVGIEAEVTWEQGGRSIYFRDPAGNSVEFAPTTLWGGGWNRTG